MLFAVKNDWRLAVGVALLFFLMAWGWGIDLEGMNSLSSFLLSLLISGVMVGLSDGVLYFLFKSLLGRAYLERYTQFTQFFAPQGWREMVAGGVLAVAEEGVFRGVVLVFLLDGLGWSIPAGVILTSLLFGLTHLIPQRNLAVFALWSIWESLLLSLLFLWTDSLLIVMVVHGLHDLVGFGLFAYQRKTGWLVLTE